MYESKYIPSESSEILVISEDVLFDNFVKSRFNKIQNINIVIIKVSPPTCPTNAEKSKYAL